MKSLFKQLMFAVFAFTLAGAASAQDARRGTADEAVAMVKKASAYLNDNGREKAIAAFNDPKGEFIKGDLYVFMFTFDGTALAHGQNAKMVGKNLIDLKAGEVFPIREFIKIAKSPAGTGWFGYKWPNSITKAMEEKNTYIERNGEVLIGVGTYK
ncbi:cache domain-containing protein [Massilia sp. CCM 9210]|uniref:cache domain-containing protein n=1 Tax=Massilia scottii TaxID=3057166 RepID=UPI00279675A6|nr:cache domain-containing protein [Massilia sp. CCM 9210]MDQ1813948.1 cache domain-containing protein [Massilia sp. CCM 9210]